MSQSLVSQSDRFADFRPHELRSIESATRSIGSEIFSRLHRSSAPFWTRRWWDDRLMSWAMRSPAAKVQMFRFVDVLPTLDSSADVVRHLREYLLAPDVGLPAPLAWGLRLAHPGSWLGAAVATVARRNVLGQARRFIAGGTVDEALAAVHHQRRLGRGATLDLLGEAVISPAEADAYLASYEALLERLPVAARAWHDATRLDQFTDDRGAAVPLPRVNLSLKLSALDHHFDPLDPEGSFARVAPRLRRLCLQARKAGAFLNVDMESYATKNLVIDIFCRLLEEDALRDWSDVGIVVQAYLRDAPADLERLAQWARQRGAPIWVRLVKGAYWDYETAHAQNIGWPVPVFQDKRQTDAQFEALTETLMHERHWLRPAIASHNVRSLAHAIAVARHLGVPPTGYELQLLYGMAEELPDALIALGQRVRLYMPYGDLLPGMAYLVRRLLENTSNDSFVKASFSDRVAPEVLLMNPLEPIRGPDFAAGDPSPRTTLRLHTAPTEFANEPATDFGHPENRQAMAAALDEVAHRMGDFYPLVIDGREVATDERHASISPSHRDQVVGTAAVATVEHADQAVAAALRAQRAWGGLGAEQRAACLERAADLMCQRKFELAAWIIHETGKGWREADADVAEAIDFCRYYAMGAVALANPAGWNLPGEANRFTYLQRGVAAIIAPWNFPLAILTGMTAAALVTGNAAIMKPAEQSAVVGAQLMQIWQAAGVPAGVVQYLPGRGEVVGARLVEHPDVSMIAFTGSREVGLAIQKRAAEVSAQPIGFVKRVVSEMGGKNSIIIDDDADLDEAITGVVQSAFGYQGQKCSACSRLIVVRGAYETTLRRLVDATRALAIGPAESSASQIGPVIDEASRDKILKYIEIGRSEAREVLAADAGQWSTEGWYVGPHIFADVAPTARLAQEEIFGPVLAVLVADSFDQAIEIANATQFALTGGVYSRSPEHLAMAEQRFMVGNLYLNRPITGALVGRQPFGGFRLSGNGTQAGGPDYLLQFVVPRTITENTMRRGFAPSD